MKKYQKPKMEKISLENDVILTSGSSGGGSSHTGCCSGTEYSIELPELP